MIADKNRFDKLRDMIPGYFLDRMPNIILVQIAHELCNLPRLYFKLSIHPSRYNYLLFCKVWRPLYVAIFAALFVHHVMNVVSFTPNEKVIWPNAFWVVTGMENAQFIRNDAVFYFEGETVCSETFSKELEPTVTKSIWPSFPKPTSIAFVNFCPKPRCKRFGSFYIQTLTRAVNPFIALSFENLFTNWTGVSLVGTVVTHCDAFRFSHGAEARKVALRGLISLEPTTSGLTVNT